MGGRPTSGFSYENNIPLIYNYDLSVGYEVISSILALEIGQELNIGITAPVEYLQQVLPEFTFNHIRYNLYKVSRFMYLGFSDRCCITNEDFFNTSGYFISCPPALKKPGTTRSCDVTLSSYCFANPVNTHICRNWFEGYVRDRGYDIFTNQGYQYCKTESQRNSNKFCDAYLTIMRANPDSTIHDKFIDSVRDNTFRCSYPLRKTQQLARNATLPRVCWDPNCIHSSLWKLKYEDYLKRLSCTVTVSNVNYTVTNPDTLNNIIVQSESSDIVNFIHVLQNQNIYTKPLQELGKSFLDVFQLTTLLGISILILW